MIDSCSSTSTGAVRPSPGIFSAQHCHLSGLSVCTVLFWTLSTSARFTFSSLPLLGVMHLRFSLFWWHEFWLRWGHWERGKHVAFRGGGEDWCIRNPLKLVSPNYDLWAKSDLPPVFCLFVCFALFLIVTILMSVRWPPNPIFKRPKFNIIKPLFSF